MSAVSYPSVDNPLPMALGLYPFLHILLNGEFGNDREAGFKWVRMDLLWEATEMVKGQYNFHDKNIY